MKELRLLLILAVSLFGSLGLLAASEILWLPQTAENFGFGAGLFLLGWFVLSVCGYWSLRFKALLNGTVMGIALSFAMYQGLKYLSGTFLPDFSVVDRWVALVLSALTALTVTKTVSYTHLRAHET